MNMTTAFCIFAKTAVREQRIPFEVKANRSNIETQQSTQEVDDLLRGSIKIAKGNFRFAPVMYLNAALQHVDQMPQSTLDEIIEKYVEMNIAHPFREENGRSTRIWLDLILKNEIGQVVDWNLIDKNDYLLAMERSPIKDVEIKHLLKNALTNKINDREVYMKGIDTSYYYEGYSVYKATEL